LPANMPEPRGLGFTIRAKVDADHASDTVTRHSRTGFLVWVNCALVYWMSKKQTSVESSSFGSEFIAMKQCCEYIRGLCYKLRMMGIPCEGPAYISGDNQSVLANTTIPDSVLKKKSQSIAFHFVCKGTARDEWRTDYVNTHDNESDLLTKLLPHGEKRKRFVIHIGEMPLLWKCITLGWGLKSLKRVKQCQWGGVKSLVTWYLMLRWNPSFARLDGSLMDTEPLMLKGPLTPEFSAGKVSGLP
jgi:hypothetical protein